MIIRLQDSDDRNAVYESKFNQNGTGPGQGIVIHENLTAKRAKQIQVLGDMWEKSEVANYYTKNGVIMARKSKDQRYVMIRPDMTRDDIIEAVAQAPLKSQQQTHNQNLLRSQTFSTIPSGRVASQRADLEQIATITTRSASRGGRGRGRGSDN